MKFHQVKIEDVLRHFSSSVNGISETKAKARLAQYGPNEIQGKREISPIRVFFSQFNSFIVYILIAAVFLSSSTNTSMVS